MPGKLDEISLAIGGLQASTAGLKDAFDQHCDDDERRHRENQGELRQLNANLASLTNVVTPLAKAVEAMQPVVANYQTSRFKLIGAASVIVVLFSLLGWAIQAVFGALFNWLVLKLMH